MTKIYKDPVAKAIAAILIILFIIRTLTGSRNATGAKHLTAYLFNLGFYLLIFYIIVWYAFLKKSLQNVGNSKTKTAVRYTVAIVAALLLVVIAMLAIVMLAFSGGGL